MLVTCQEMSEAEGKLFSGDVSPEPFMDEAGRRWVLKVSSPEEDDAFLEFETGLLDFLSRCEGLPVPAPASAPDGARLVRVPRDAGPPLRVRLLEHLPGVALAAARPRSPALLEEVGALVARLASALAEHPCGPAPSRPGFDWALARAGVVMERGREAVEEPERRAVLDGALRAFQGAEEALAGLPARLVHGDLNDHNLLVGPAGPDGTRRVTGLLDFGDAHEAPPVADLAVAAAYALLETPDPLQALARVVGGYHGVRPLEEAEMALVVPLLRARLGASVAISAWRRRDHPDPDPYLLVSEAPAWATLASLEFLSWVSMRISFSASNREQVAYNIRPPGLSSGHNFSSRDDWVLTSPGS